MVSSQASSTEEYLRELSPEREAALRAIVDVVRANLPPGYRESMQYGMIAWTVPLERLPQTYNRKPLAYIALASQKQYISLYLNHVYGDPAAERWFREAYEATGKRLNMGKSCVRFRHLEDLPLDLIGQAVARTSVDEYVAAYRAVRGGTAR
jgi:Domain of unknown function (DU1801)